MTEHLRSLDEIARRHGGDRAAGMPGYDASVRYVAGRLRELGWRVTLQRVPLRVPPERSPAQNVIAEAGAGGRVVMAGAHLDSVSAGPGINDNASGVATLLAAAEALGSWPPGRVRLAFWAAEELGLVGSRHYVGALSRERRDEIAAYLNLDMVGSPNGVPAVYRDADQRLARLLRDALPGREAGVTVDGASDRAPCADAGVPVNGLYRLNRARAGRAAARSLLPPGLRHAAQRRHARACA